MNPTNLDLDTLRTLVTAHDLGGYAQAADRLGRTPSAVSLQMKRLQEDAGTPLFRKRGRGLALTEAGETTLQYARSMLQLNDELLYKLQGAAIAGTLRFGCPQDFAGLLPAVLSQFASVFPQVRVDLRVEGNGVLIDALDKGELDLVATIGFADREGAQLLGEVPLLWIASPDFAPRAEAPLPLAMLGPQCAFRKRALSGLDDVGSAYRLAATSPSLDGLWAAVLGGLGVTARSALQLPEGLTAAKSLHGFPTLGTLPVVLHTLATSSATGMERMQALLREALLQSIASKPKKLALVRKG